MLHVAMELIYFIAVVEPMVGKNLSTLGHSAMRYPGYKS